VVKVLLPLVNSAFHNISRTTPSILAYFDGAF